MDSIAAARASGALIPSSSLEFEPLLDMKKESENLLDMLRTYRYGCLRLPPPLSSPQP
ncbi:MAG: hypothetical protein KME25_32405 [Symplocastrum torsivum CPER-KK1]|uniref:Uncharacterized protein n=1 Tax=Symplocastrum torsivum CPER-KK1 TaxID=450513 RepID=A0A951PTT2_9CYAN|nr:hypothetical protein [Symplocastrum torsivum CPER-KK1]